MSLNFNILSSLKMGSVWASKFELFIILTAELNALTTYSNLQNEKDTTACIDVKETI